MRKLGKVIFIIALLAMIVLPLSAKKAMNVSWEWLLSDPDVTAYRYQLNGEAEDGWTVVDGNTSVYNATGLDPYSDYTLYLQCSYDGINWSESASSTAYALLKLEEETVAEEETVSEETVEETVFYVYGFGIENEWNGSSFKSTTLDEGVFASGDVLGFIQYEAEKYPDLASAVYYSLIDDGFILTYEEGSLDIASLIPAYRADITEYVDYLVSSAVVEETAAEEALSEEIVSVEPAFSVTFSYRGITSDITAYDTYALVTLPQGTDESVIADAAALLVAKYPEASYVTYEKDGDTVLLSYPEISGEYASSLYPVIRDEAEWYIDQILGEEAGAVENVEEEEESPVYSDTLTYRGVTTTVVVETTKSTLTLPEGMSGEDVAAVAAMISAGYPSEASLVTYSLDGDTVILTYPEQSGGFLLNALDVLRNEAMELIDMIEASKVPQLIEEEKAAAGVEEVSVEEGKAAPEASLSPSAEENRESVEEPLAEEKTESAEAEVPSPVTVEVVPEEEDSPKAKKVKASFAISLNGGVEWNYGKIVTNGMTKTPEIFPFASLSLEGQNLAHFGVFGLGLRSDISAVFIPESRNFISNPSNIWGFDFTADIKLMSYINAGICRFYVGAGFAYSAASVGYTSVHSSDALILENLNGGFGTAYALTGIAGLQFNLGSHVTLSAEGYARFFFDEPAQLDTLNVAATLGLGLKF